VRELIETYPEYMDVCKTMSKKLLSFINTYEFEDDVEAMSIVNKILEIEPEVLLQLLLKY
jgi:hypothetical protein